MSFTKQPTTSAMNHRQDPLNCPICFTAYSSTNDHHEPMICKNGHSLCSNCAKCLNNCPQCCGQLDQTQALLEYLATRQNSTPSDQENDIPEISIDHVKLTAPAQPFARGGFADMYGATWHNQPVALKALRVCAADANSLKGVLQEARLAMALNHPNVVRIFGVVTMESCKGILMEKADRGSLRAALNVTNMLSFDQRVSISINIVDGLNYIHSRQMVHRDLKPENVLLFDINSQLTAKIADFGLSRVLPASLAKTTMIGTLHYMAPELLKDEARYGSEVDVYSLTIVLYEVFSGRNVDDAFANIKNKTKLINAVRKGQRPKLPNSFPSELQRLVKQGWSAKHDARPALPVFKEALCKLKERTDPIDDVEYSTAGAITYTTASSQAGAGANDDFEGQLRKLEESTKAFKLDDARSQVEACRRLWKRSGGRTTLTASSARYHSQKGFVHHWFGEYSDAYAETYKALRQLHALCLSGTRVEDEQLVTILRYAAQVCTLQDQYAAAEVLIAFAVRHAKSKLSAAAFAEVLEDLGSLIHALEDLKFNISVASPPRQSEERLLEIIELIKSKSPESVSNRNESIVHFHLAGCYRAEAKQPDEGGETKLKIDRIESALGTLNKADRNDIWVAACSSFKGNLLRLSTNDQKTLDEAKQLQEDSLRTARGILGDNNYTVSLIYLRLGSVLEDLEQFADAASMYKKSIKSAEKSLGPNNTRVASALECLACLYHNRLQKYNEAKTLYLRSIQIWINVLGSDHPHLISSYRCLESVYISLGRSDEAANLSVDISRLESKEFNKAEEKTWKALQMLLIEVQQTDQTGGEAIEASENLLIGLLEFLEVAKVPESLRK